MATSKRKRKERYVKYFSTFTNRGHFGSMWYMYKIVCPKTLNELLAREVDTQRLRKRIEPFLDFSQMEPMFKRWSVPLVFTNPCKKSRIKNHTNTYRMFKAEYILHPSGNYHNQHTLMNYYLAKGGNEE